MMVGEQLLCNAESTAADENKFGLGWKHMWARRIPELFLYLWEESSAHQIRCFYNASVFEEFSHNPRKVYIGQYCPTIADTKGVAESE